MRVGCSVGLLLILFDVSLSSCDVVQKTQFMQCLSVYEPSKMRVIVESNNAYEQFSNYTSENINCDSFYRVLLCAREGSGCSIEGGNRFRKSFVAAFLNCTTELDAKGIDKLADCFSNVDRAQGHCTSQKKRSEFDESVACQVDAYKCHNQLRTQYCPHLNPKEMSILCTARSYFLHPACVNLTRCDELIDAGTRIPSSFYPLFFLFFFYFV
ncbi:hypothetical protein M3Y94_00759800 [Aphelenchoides besseyi]|nr:hypothetical protein M3Y94_00759800 [Aphelenchoides besseyi]KAI6232158.1 hypothetical protein M3Y95_00457300 [Aphelenchoides besseyi]